MRFLNYLSRPIKGSNKGRLKIIIYREDAEMSMFSMLKEVVVRIKSELEEERQIRMDGHESLLTILEEAYEKMEETHAKVQ